MQLQVSMQKTEKITYLEGKKIKRRYSLTYLKG